VGGKVVRKTVGLHMSPQHPLQHPAYRSLLAFLVSLNYTDFSTITSDEVEVLLREAQVEYTLESYVVDRHPYTAYGPSIDCTLSQETGHQNRINFSFDENGVLLTLQLHTASK
jgi:hypothetical protein